MKETKNQIDVIDLIPNNERKLIDIQSKVKNIGENIGKNQHNNNGKLDEEIRSKYNDILLNLLDQVGDLSIPAFEIRDVLEKNYITRHKGDHKNARKLFIKHYESIHKPYDQAKNNIWKLLEITIEKK